LSSTSLRAERSPDDAALQPGNQLIDVFETA
jgi:hypothetical protein